MEILRRSGEIQNDATHEITKSKLSQNPRFLSTPITETQKATTRDITEGLKPIREGLETVRKEVYDIPDIVSGMEALKKKNEENEEDEEEEEDEGEEDKNIGDLARYYLEQQYRDTTFGIKKRTVENEKRHYIGNTHVIVDNNDIIIKETGEKFIGTPGLWELITSRDPIYFDENDKYKYEKLMIKTGVIHHDNDKKNPHPKANRGKKWRKLIGPIWYKSQGFSEENAIKMTTNRRYRERLVKEMKKIKKEYEGEGVVVIPSDPNALLERLDLLLASQEAGHTGVRNELVSICDELKRQGVLDTKAYKKLNSNIKK